MLHLGDLILEAFGAGAEGSSSIDIESVESAAAAARSATLPDERRGYLRLAYLALCGGDRTASQILDLHLMRLTHMQDFKHDAEIAAVKAACDALRLGTWEAAARSAMAALLAACRSMVAPPADQFGEVATVPDDRLLVIPRGQSLAAASDRPVAQALERAVSAALLLRTQVALTPGYARHLRLGAGGRHRIGKPDRLVETPLVVLPFSNAPGLSEWEQLLLRGVRASIWAGVGYLQPPGPLLDRRVAVFHHEEEAMGVVGHGCVHVALPIPDALGLTSEFAGRAFWDGGELGWTIPQPGLQDAAAGLRYQLFGEI
jgi:hypothetical protein